MIHIPPHIASLQPYKPGKPGANLFDEPPEREVVLSSNENNRGPSPLAMAAVSAHLEKFSLYPDPVSGALRSALSKRLGVAETQLCVGNGSDSILYNIMNSFFSPGQTLLTSEGAFASAKVYARLNQVPMIETPMLPGYRFDLEAILDAIDEHTQMIYLVNPNNPTGTMIPEAELKQFIERVPEHIIVLVDEAYFEFAGALASDYPDSSRYGYKNVLVLRTFSKAYGLAGLRLGFAIGDEFLINVLSKTKLPFDPNIAAQIAGLAALEDEAFLQATIDNNSAQMQLLAEEYRRLSIPFITSYANFITLELENEVRVETVFEGLRRRGVLTRRLASFGLPHCLRVSIGLPEENEYYLRQLEALS